MNGLHAVLLVQKVSSDKFGFHIYVGLYTSYGHQCFMLIHADGLVLTGFHTHAESYVHIYIYVSLYVYGLESSYSCYCYTI